MGTGGVFKEVWFIEVGAVSLKGRTGWVLQNELFLLGSVELLGLGGVLMDKDFIFNLIMFNNHDLILLYTITV